MGVGLNPARSGSSVSLPRDHAVPQPGTRHTESCYGTPPPKAPPDRPPRRPVGGHPQFRQKCPRVVLEAFELAFGRIDDVRHN